MPGQTWPGAGASLLGMWVVLMVAMRRSEHAGDRRFRGAAYFGVDDIDAPCREVWRL